MFLSFLSKDDVFDAMKKALSIKVYSQAEREAVDTDIKRLKVELEELKTTKKMEQREIEHLVKLKEEKNKLEYEKKEIGLMKEYQLKEMKLQEELHNKVMAAIEKHTADMQKVYAEIIQRLPNVNMEIHK